MEKNGMPNGIAGIEGSVDMIAASKTRSLLFDCPRTVEQNARDCLTPAEGKLIHSIPMANVFRW